MKNFALILFFGTLNIIQGNCQRYVSDSVCYEDINSGEIVKCDTSDRWEIRRNGDMIEAYHFFSKYYATATTFGIDYKLEKKSGYLKDSGFKSAEQVYQCTASTKTKTYSAGINWQTLDFDDDGVWDQLIFYWLESRSPLVRIIYCHQE